MDKKKYEITSETIGKLKDGQIFSNFLELSTYLNVFSKNGKPLDGTSKKHFLEELNRFVEFKKEGKRFVIVKIRPDNEVLPPLPTRNKGKFSLRLKNVIAVVGWSFFGHQLQYYERVEWLIRIFINIQRIYMARIPSGLR